MSITRSMFSRPSTPSFAAGSVEASLSLRATYWYSVSLTSVDLPEPDTPVTHVMHA
jgi:hypothetical protein